MPTLPSLSIKSLFFFSLILDQVRSLVDPVWWPYFQNNYSSNVYYVLSALYSDVCLLGA